MNVDSKIGKSSEEHTEGPEASNIDSKNEQSREIRVGTMLQLRMPKTVPSSIKNKELCKLAV